MTLKDLLEVSGNSNQDMVESGGEEWGDKVIGHVPLAPVQHMQDVANHLVTLLLTP